MQLRVELSFLWDTFAIEKMTENKIDRSIIFAAVLL
jgi:hypothetical protein